MSYFKILIVISITAVLVFASVVYIGKKEEGLIIQAEIGIKGSVSENKTIPVIESISAHFEPYSAVSVPKGSGNIDSPGIVAVVIYNQQMIGEWTSVPYKGTGMYNITIGLSTKPNPGDMVNVIIRVLDKNAKTIAIQNRAIRYESG